MIVLQTPRLHLRRLHEGDLDTLASIYADPDVMRYIRDGSIRDREQTAEHLATISRSWEELGFGLLGVEIRDTGELAGWVGLAVPEFLPEVLPTVEIGWRLAKRYWGSGIATEGARAVLRFGFGDCGLGRVVSIRHVDNHASGRVMEKLGMHLDRRTTVPATGQPVAVYALTRAEHVTGQ